MEIAHLVDLHEDFPRELRDLFNETDFTTYGNPWYYRWYMSRKPWDEGKISAWERINEHLVSLGLNENDAIILTDGW